MFDVAVEVPALDAGQVAAVHIDPVPTLLGELEVAGISAMFRHEPPEGLKLLDATIGNAGGITVRFEAYEPAGGSAVALTLVLW